MDSTRVVFVSRFNRIMAVALWVIVALLLVTALVNGHGTTRLLALVPAAFGAILGWTVLWNPHVVVDDVEIRVVNVFSTVRIPWAALVHVDTRFALTLVTPHRKVAAWAAPAPGRAGVAIARRRGQRHGRVVPSVGDGQRAAGDLLTTDSGDAAYLVRERWDSLREAGRIVLGVADSTPVPLRVHVVTLVALVATGVGGWFAIAAQ
jgi:hypothetical protein